MGEIQKVFSDEKQVRSLRRFYSDLKNISRKKRRIRWGSFKNGKFKALYNFRTNRTIFGRAGLGSEKSERETGMPDAQSSGFS